MKHLSVTATGEAETISFGHEGHRLPQAVLLIIAGIILSCFALFWGRQTATFVWMLWLIGCCFYFGLKDPGMALCMLAFSFPFEFIFFAWRVGRHNMMSYVVLGLALLWVIRRPEFRTKLKLHEWIYTILLVWCGITLLWAEDVPRGFGFIFTHVGILATVFIFSRGIKSYDFIFRCLRYFIAGVFLLGAILSFYYQRSGWVEYYGNLYISTFGAADEVSQYDFGNAALVGFIGALALSDFANTGLKRMRALTVAFFLAILIILTLGRALMIELIICSLVWALLSPSLLGRLKKLTFLLVLAIAALVIAYLVNPEALGFRWGETAFYAMEGTDLKVLSSGRTQIWANSLPWFQENPFRGIGFGQFTPFHEAMTGWRRGAHSAIITFLVETGLIGASLLIALCVALGYNAWQAKPWRHVTLAWWVYFIVEVAFHGYGRNKVFWIAAGLTTVVIRLSSNNKRTLPVPKEDSNLVGVHFSRGGVG